VVPSGPAGPHGIDPSHAEGGQHAAHDREQPPSPHGLPALSSARCLPHSSSAQRCPENARRPTPPTYSRQARPVGQALGACPGGWAESPPESVTGRRSFRGGLRRELGPGRSGGGPRRDSCRRTVRGPPGRQRGARADDPLFHGPQGGHLRYGAFCHRRWLPTLKALGLPAVGLHVLRHSAAARMIQAGGSPKAVQAILGHRSAAFTLSVYGHRFDADLDDLPARLDSCCSDVCPDIGGDRRGAPFAVAALGGAGWDRTIGQRIMSPLL